MKSAARVLPAAAWLPRYERRWLRGEADRAPPGWELDASPNTDRGTYPEAGTRRCPATFRVRNNDRIGRLRLRAGSYYITTSRLNCTAAASMFAEFLEHPDDMLPRPWRVDPEEAAFWRGRTTIGFWVKRAR